MDQWGEIQIPETEMKKKPNYKIAIVIIAICILVAAVVGVFFLRSYYADERRLLRGVQNLAKEIGERQQLWEGMAETAPETGMSAVKIDSSLNLSGEELPITIGVDTVMLRDNEARKMQGSTSFSVMNRELLEMEIYAEDEQLMIALPDLFRQNLAFRSEQIDRQYNDSLLAEKFGRIEGQEISIQFFTEQRDSLWKQLADWENLLKKWKESRDINTDLPEITIEKLEEQVELVDPASNKRYQCTQYRILFPKEQIESIITDVTVPVVEQDVSLLIAIDEDDRIIRISLEEPLSLNIQSGENQALADYEGSITFLGQERSIDDIVVSMQAELHLEEPLVFDGIGNGILSSFGNSLDKEDNKVKLQAEAEIIYDEEDIHVTASLNQMTLSVDRLGNYKIAGEIDLEPLKEEIQPLEGETIQLFEITEAEYEDLEDQLKEKIRKWLMVFSFSGFLN